MFNSDEILSLNIIISSELRRTDLFGCVGRDVEKEYCQRA